jgi:hypothetical protein
VRLRPNAGRADFRERLVPDDLAGMFRVRDRSADPRSGARGVHQVSGPAGEAKSGGIGCHVKNLTPVRAIRQKCMEYQGGSRKAIRNCAADCPLHPYRMGRNPNRAGIGPEGGPRSPHILEKPRSRVGSSSPRIDSGGGGRRTGAVSNLPASRRRRIIRAAEAFLQELQGAELVDKSDGTEQRAGSRQPGAE